MVTVISERFRGIGEYAAAGMYEEPNRNLFYRKALGIRRFYENCILPDYHGETLYPSGCLPDTMDVRPHFMWGLLMDHESMNRRDKELADLFYHDFEQYQPSVPPEHCVAGAMFTHSMPNYERILQEGFSSYIPRIEKIQDTDMREGLLHVLEGIRNYRERCIAYLKSVNAEKQLIQALQKVPFEPAETIYEAIAGWNFILYLDNCDNLGCVAAGLLPYFHGENVIPLLENLFDNLDANNGYSMALGTDYTPLTLQCLEASKGKRRPMIELFVNEDTPDEIWDKAFEVIRTGNGQPAFYNEHALLPSLQKRIGNIPEEDLKKFCGGGCTESMLAGLSNVGSLDAGINLLLILEKSLYTDLVSSKTFEEFYNHYLSSVKEVVEIVTREISESQKNRAKYNPVPMRTLLIDDCIDNAMEFNSGGARYRWSLVNFAGMINVIDALLVVRDYIFIEKRMSAGELLAHLCSNDQTFLAQARKHEVCYGKDDENADALANRLSTDIYSLLDGKTPYLGGCFLPASIQFMSQADAGKGIGATPDGREACAPLCDSLGAIFGKDTQGPTALLKSVTALNLERVLGIPVLNFNITSSFENAVLKALVQGYMKLGGIQLQMTCTSAQTLQEAYENPDMHRNLIVRVGGYSEYFCRLSDGLKRMVINRTIQQLG